MAGLLIPAVVASVVLIVALHTRWRRLQLLEAAAAAMDSAESRYGSSVTGTKNTRTIQVRCWSTGRSGYFTEVDCSLPDLPLELELRPQGIREEGQIRRGEAIDVSVGDPTFDPYWVVEGAPVDVVRRVLTDSIRSRWNALMVDELLQPDARHLRLRVRGICEPDWIGKAISFMADLSAAIEPAFAASDEAASARAEVVGSPYRGEVRKPDITAERAQEQSRLQIARNRRSATANLALVVAVMLAVTALVLLVSLVR